MLTYMSRETMMSRLSQKLGREATEAELDAAIAFVEKTRKETDERIKAASTKDYVITE
jgi:hypothetical protein